MQGIDEIIPVDVYVPGCPPSPEALIAAVMKIQERIQKGEQAKAPAGRAPRWARRATAPSTAARGAQAWTKDDAERAEPGPAAPRRASRCACCRRRRDRARTTMASAAETRRRRRPPAPRARGARPAGARWATRVLRGRRLPRRPGASPSTARRLGRGGDAAARPPRARLQALPRPLRRGLPRHDDGDGPLRGRAARSTPSRRSTTCG